MNRYLLFYLCIKRVCLNWNFIVNDVQSATYSCHGAPCQARDLFSWLYTRVKVHISLWTIREYPKRHFWYLSESGDTFLPLEKLRLYCKDPDGVWTGHSDKSEQQPNRNDLIVRAFLCQFQLIKLHIVKDWHHHNLHTNACVKIRSFVIFSKLLYLSDILAFGENE